MCYAQLQAALQMDRKDENSPIHIPLYFQKQDQIYAAKL